MAGQSGRSSSVALAIESLFCAAPLSGSGNPYTLGIPSTNPMRAFTVQPGGGFGVKPTKEVGKNELDGDFSIKRTTMTAKPYDGKDSFKVDPENLYYWLLGLFGRDVETTLASGAYQHVFTHNKYMPSFVMEEQFGNATSGRLSTGLCVGGINLVHSGILMAEATYYAHRQIPNRYPNGALTDTDYDFTSSPGILPSQLGGDWSKTVKLTTTPTYVDVAEGNCGNGPLVFASMQNGSASGFSSNFITINDVAYAGKILPGYNVDFMRDIERFQVGGGGYDFTQPVGNDFDVNGKWTLLFEDNTIPANVLANCKFGINMKFVGPQIGNTGFNYSYELYLPRVKMLDADVIRTDKAIITGGSFQAEKDAVLGYEAKITLVNSFTHASLAGTVASNPGGLGGWAAS